MYHASFTLIVNFFPAAAAFSGMVSMVCATLAQPPPHKEQKCLLRKKEQAQKTRYLMLRERSIHLVESRRMT